MCTSPSAVAVMCSSTDLNSSSSSEFSSVCGQGSDASASKPGASRKEGSKSPMKVGDSPLLIQALSHPTTNLSVRQIILQVASSLSQSVCVSSLLTLSAQIATARQNARSATAASDIIPTVGVSSAFNFFFLLLLSQPIQIPVQLYSIEAFKPAIYIAH